MIPWAPPGPYDAFLGAVAAVRLAELAVSARNTRALRARGATVRREPAYAAMVAVHTGLLLGALAEVHLLHRSPAPGIVASAVVALAAAYALKAWVLATLRGRWNVRITSGDRLDVVDSGPYRFVRHPNYLAVVVEVAAIPLVGGAWWTAIAGSIANGLVLAARIPAEEAALSATSDYRARLGDRARFIPFLF